MNELEVSCEVEGQTARISLAGEFDLAGEPLFEQQLERLTPAPAQTVVLDLRGLTLIGSRGLAAILRADDRSRGEGWQLLVQGGSAWMRACLNWADRCPDEVRELNGAWESIATWKRQHAPAPPPARTQRQLVRDSLPLGPDPSGPSDKPAAR